MKLLQEKSDSADNRSRFLPYTVSSLVACPIVTVLTTKQIVFTPSITRVK